MNRRVVITGLGVVTPIGSQVPLFWSNLLAGKSGISTIDTFDVTDFSTRIAGLVRDFHPEDFIDKKDVRRIDRFTQFAIAAAYEAVADAGLTIDENNADDIGVYIGSGIGGISTMLENYRALVDRGPRRVSPFLVPMMISNMASGQVSILLGARGPNSSPISACATGTHAVGDAFRIIQRGDADAMICGGAEAAVVDLSLAGFSNMKALSTRNDEPERASRPFDRDRDGFVMAEGAGILVVESLEYALARGARIYAEVIGYGMSGDAYHITAPSPEGFGAFRAMRQAMKNADLPLEAVDYINAHGTSTDYNDKFETMAVKKLFGDHAYKLCMSSIKSMTGHTLGAAGGIEAIATALTLYEGKVPPTTNYENPDEDCDLDYVPNMMREMNVEVAMSNSLGFGGHNASLVLRKFHP